MTENQLTAQAAEAETRAAAEAFLACHAQLPAQGGCQSCWAVLQEDADRDASLLASTVKLMPARPVYGGDDVRAEWAEGVIPALKRALGPDPARPVTGGIVQ